ncbi:MAG: hypothetical protein WC728_05820 [Elusimicrobiota bacterium]
MTTQVDVLKLVAQRLERAGIAYMVSGSVALNFYARPRMTRDIDIVVELGRGDWRRLYRLFSEDFYADEEDIRESVERRGIFNVIHSAGVVKVDFVVRKETPYRREEFGRRRTVDLEGTPLSVVAAEDLLLSKLDWAKASRSEMQLKDARSIVECVPGMDWDYLRRWSRELGIEGMLEEVRGGKP